MQVAVRLGESLKPVSRIGRSRRIRLVVLGNRGELDRHGVAQSLKTGRREGRYEVGRRYHVLLCGALNSRSRLTLICGCIVDEQSKGHAESICHLFAPKIDVPAQVSLAREGGGRSHSIESRVKGPNAGLQESKAELIFGQAEFGNERVRLCGRYGAAPIRDLRERGRYVTKATQHRDRLARCWKLESGLGEAGDEICLHVGQMGKSLDQKREVDASLTNFYVSIRSRNCILVGLDEEGHQMLGELDRLRGVASLGTIMDQRRNFEEIGEMTTLILFCDVLDVFTFFKHGLASGCKCICCSLKIR